MAHQFHPFLFDIEAINFIGKSHTFKNEIILSYLRLKRIQHILKSSLLNRFFCKLKDTSQSYKNSTYTCNMKYHSIMIIQYDQFIFQIDTKCKIPK